MSDPFVGWPGYAPQSAPGVLVAKGWNGTAIFDGSSVVIRRSGFRARATLGKGEKRIPVTAIAAVELKPAGPVMQGLIRFTVPGGIEQRSRFGRRTQDAAYDENAVLFRRYQQAVFEQLRAAVESAISAPPTAHLHYERRLDAAEQLERLASLHASGALTDEEFAAAKAQALGRSV